MGKGFTNPSQQNAHAIQTEVLVKLIGRRSARKKPSLGDEPKPMDHRDFVALSELWIKLERFKRELRGIPPLAPAALKDILKNAKAEAQRTLAETVDIDAVEA